MSEELPEGWAFAVLSDVIGAGLFTDGDWVESKDQDPNGGVRLIQLADVGDGEYRNRSARFLTREKSEELDCTFLTEGDLLLARMPEPLGRACLFPGDPKPSVTVVDVCVIRPDQRAADSRWLLHTINSPQIRSSMTPFEKGTTRKRISRSNLSQIIFPVPPLAEQRRIVAKVEQILARVNAARERLGRVPATLKRFRQSVLAAACSGRLTADWREKNPGVESAEAILRALGIDSPSDVIPEAEIPDSWRWVRFGDVLSEFRNGLSTKPNQTPPGTPILRINAVRPCEVSFSDLRYLECTESHQREYALQNGDLLFTRYNGSLDLLGVCGMVRGINGRSMVYPDKLMRGRFSSPLVLPEYCEKYFSTPAARARMIGKAKSSAGQNGVSGSDVKNQPLTLPPLPEQREIVRRVSALFALADGIEARLAAGRKRVDALTQAVLAKAFRGELVPTEAELARAEGRAYEPASALLERVRAEAGGAAKPRKGRKRS